MFQEQPGGHLGHPQQKDITMSSLQATIRNFLEGRQIPHHEVEEDDVFITELPGENGRYHIVIHADGEKPSVECFLSFPLRAAKAHRNATIDFCNTINQRLRWGSFQVDREDGEVTFRNSVRLGQQSIDQLMFDHLLLGGMLTLEVHFEALVSVATGQSTPADAAATVLDKIKGKRSRSPQVASRLRGLAEDN
jgi:hypothetical protein